MVINDLATIGVEGEFDAGKMPGLSCLDNFSSMWLPERDMYIGAGRMRSKVPLYIQPCSWLISPCRK